MEGSLGDDLVEGITPSSVRRYLLASSWSSPSLVRKDQTVDLFEKEDIFQLLVPRSAGSPEYYRRLRDVVSVLSGLEDRAQSEVATAIRWVGYDILRSAVPTQYVRDESIKFSAAAAFVNEMRGILASTATTELNPLPYYGRLRKAGTEYADRCRFGHTYRGSFGFQVESPLPEPVYEQAEMFVMPPVPFERRVIQRLVNGINTIVSASESGNIGEVVEGVKAGFSANACEQVADFVERVSPGGIILSVDYSIEIAPESGEVKPQMRLDARLADVARDAARSMRRDELIVEAAVFGPVYRLQNQANPSDITAETGHREVMVLWSSEDYGDIQVNISLNAPNYLEAVQAHAAGIPIYVKGVLHRFARKWALREAHDFFVPEPSDFVSLEGTEPFTF